MKGEVTRHPWTYAAPPPHALRRTLAATHALGHGYENDEGGDGEGGGSEGGKGGSSEGGKGGSSEGGKEAHRGQRGRREVQGLGVRRRRARRGLRGLRGDEACERLRGLLPRPLVHVVQRHADAARAPIAPAWAQAERAARHPQSGSESMGGARAQRIRVGVFALLLMVRDGVRGAGAVPAAPHRRTRSSRWMALHSLRAHTARQKRMARWAREFGSRSGTGDVARAPGPRRRQRALSPSHVAAPRRERHHLAAFATLPPRLAYLFWYANCSFFLLGGSEPPTRVDLILPHADVNRLNSTCADNVDLSRAPSIRRPT